MKSPSSSTKGENQVLSEFHVYASTSFFGDFSRELLGLIEIGVFYSPILGFIVISILYTIFRLSSVSNLLIIVLLTLLLVVLLVISFVGVTEESKRHLSVLEYLLVKKGVKRGHTSYLMSYGNFLMSYSLLLLSTTFWLTFFTSIANGALSRVSQMQNIVTSSQSSVSTAILDAVTKYPEGLSLLAIGLSLSCMCCFFS